MTQRTKNQNALEIGLWNAECDRCGFKFKNVDLRKEWNGLMTCKDCWEPRHPQDFLKGVPDDSSVPWSRPDSDADTNTTDINGDSIITDNSVDYVGDTDKLLTVGTDHPIQIWNTELSNTRIVAFNNTNANKGDRFNIYYTAPESAHPLVIISIPARAVTINSVIVIEYTGTSWLEVSYTPTGL